MEVGEASFATATSANASSSTDSWGTASRVGARAVLGAFTVNTQRVMGCEMPAEGDGSLFQVHNR
jgi:hypothetical protein